MKKSILIIGLLSMLMSLPILSPAANPPVKENWMNVYLTGQKLGYQYETREETIFEGEPVIKLYAEMISKLKRFGADFDVRQVSLIYLGKDFKPRYSQYDENMMGSERHIISRVKNGKLEISTIMSGNTTINIRDWTSNQQFDASILESITRDGFIAGTTYQFEVYAPELGNAFQVTVSVGSSQRVSASELWYEGIPVKLEYKGTQALSAEYFVTKSGDMIKAEIGNYGMSMIKTTEKDAKNLEATFELSDYSHVASNVTFINPERITQVKFKVNTVEGNIGDYIMEDSRQKWVSATTANEGILLITSPDGILDFKENWPVNIPASVPSFLTASSPYIEAKDIEISSTARSIIGTEKNAWKAAVKLSSWVNDYVENKGFDTGFSSAKQTFQTRKGDCKSHSVLLAALTRSLGIPTKLIVGLAAVEEGFYYHMWTEVYVGQWVALDPTFNEDRVDALHIKLGETRVKEDEIGDYALQVLKSVKKIKLEILEFKENGKINLPQDFNKSSQSGGNDLNSLLQQVLGNLGNLGNTDLNNLNLDNLGNLDALKGLDQ